MWPRQLFAALMILVLPDVGLAAPAPAPKAPKNPPKDGCGEYDFEVLPGGCSIMTWYCVTGHSKHWSKPALATGNTIEGEGSLAIGRLHGTSKTVFFDASVSLPLSKIAKIFDSMSLGASYMIGTTESSTQTVTVNCPEGVECGALASRGYVTLTGKRYTSVSEMCVEKSKAEPFKANYPWKVEGGGQGDEGNLRIKTEACSVGEKVKGMKTCPGELSKDKSKDKPKGKPKLEPFPGKPFFKKEPKSPIIEAMGKRLEAKKVAVYTDGPGPQWTEVDRESYRRWQVSFGHTGGGADGWPGPDSWEALEVPKVSKS